ncbi:COG5470 Uncharacterized conserved protein [Rhabdaerophilaceae bacterium]
MSKVENAKPAYAIARLWNVRLGPGIVEYLNRIDATLQPFCGRFIVHGPAIERVEGAWPEGDLIIIGFPDTERLKAWYVSADYAAIKALRTDHSEGELIFVEGVSDKHSAPDVLTGQK